MLAHAQAVLTWDDEYVKSNKFGVLIYLVYNVVSPAVLHEINFHSTVADGSTFDVNDEHPVKLGYLQNTHVL